MAKFPSMSVQNPIGTDAARYFTPKNRAEFACYKTTSGYAISNRLGFDSVISQPDGNKCDEILRMHRFLDSPPNR